MHDQNAGSRPSTRDPVSNRANEVRVGVSGNLATLREEVESLYEDLKNAFKELHQITRPVPANPSNISEKRPCSESPLSEGIIDITLKVALMRAFLTESIRSLDL